jgi:hypothetical protein
MRGIRFLPIAFFLIPAICLGADVSDWQIRKSDHFIIYYKIDEQLIDNIATRAEYLYDKLADSLGFARFDFWLWEDRAKIYIYQDKESYLGDTTGLPHWSEGVAFYREKIIKTYRDSPRFLDSLLPHELTHIIFREFVGFRQDIPLWLDEGIACYYESGRRQRARQIVESALRQKRLITLNQLNSLDSSDLKEAGVAVLFYAESTNVVEFLISLDPESFGQFCRGLRDGKSLDSAISFAYSGLNSLNDLNQAWLRHLGALR